MGRTVQSGELLRSEPKSTRLIEIPPELAERLLTHELHLAETLGKELSPLRCKLVATFNGISIEGDTIAVLLGGRILETLAKAVPMKGTPSSAQAEEAIRATIEYGLRHDLVFRLKGLIHAIQPMSLSQVTYMNALLSQHEQLIVAVGPTGSGKTHLAIAAGLSLLAENAVKQIIFTRPHVRLAGEVVTPAVRAETEADAQFAFVEDIFQEFVGHTQFEEMIAQRRLEIAPMGRLCGRTFKNAFVIVDEAQNTTIEKMRMAVTRIGLGTRMVITGDPAHIDLYEKQTSGLAHLLRMLEGTDIASIHRLESRDIVRSPLVRQLEELYAQHGGVDALKSGQLCD